MYKITFVERYGSPTHLPGKGGCSVEALIAVAVFGAETCGVCLGRRLVAFVSEPHVPGIFGFVGETAAGRVLLTPAYVSEVGGCANFYHCPFEIIGWVAQQNPNQYMFIAFAMHSIRNTFGDARSGTGIRIQHSTSPR